MHPGSKGAVGHNHRILGRDYATHAWQVIEAKQEPQNLDTSRNKSHLLDIMDSLGC